MTINEIDNRIVEAVYHTAAMYPIVMKIGIFGSYARGDHTKKSDIDLVFECDTDSNILEKLNFYADMKKIMGNAMKKKTDVVDYVTLITKGYDIDEDDEIITQNILNDIVWIYERV